MTQTLNAHYLEHIAPAASKEMVEAHEVLHGRRLDLLCYLTAAAVAWALTGVDCVPPFSGVWLTAERGTGPADADRVVAFSDDDDSEFDATHVLVVLLRGGKTVVIDSCLWEQRGLTVRVMDGAPEVPIGQCARFVLLPKP